MSWFHWTTNAVDARSYASPAEIAACFEDQSRLLGNLAFLVTGDPGTADRAIATASAITLRGNTPFRDWLLEWAKAATITAATSLNGDAIRACEAMYKDRRCPHVEHLCHLDDEQRVGSLALILQMNAQDIIAELDPLCRAILVLRIAIRSSVQDCSLRLNVSRSAAAAANCVAMTWLDYRHVKPVESDHNVRHVL